MDAERVLVPLLDGHRNVHRLAQALLEERNVETGVARVLDVGLRVVHQHLEVAAVLIFGAHALDVFVQFGGVVGLGKNVFQEDRVRDADRLQVLHRRSQGAGVHVLVSLKPDVPHLHLGSFADHEGHADRGGRNGTNFGADRRKLAPVLGQQLFQYNLGLLDLGRIVLAFYRKTDLAVFEAIQNVAGGNRTQAGVVDLADRGTFFDEDVNDPALGRLFPFKPDVLEITGVPKRVEVAFQGGTS